MTSFLQNLITPSLVAIVGLIVLIALGDVTAAVGVPVITGLAGVHLGSTLGSSPTPPTQFPTA